MLTFFNILGRKIALWLEVEEADQETIEKEKSPEEREDVSFVIEEVIKLTNVRRTQEVDLVQEAMTQEEEVESTEDHAHTPETEEAMTLEAEVTEEEEATGDTSTHHLSVAEDQDLHTTAEAEIEEAQDHTVLEADRLTTETERTQDHHQEVEAEEEMIVAMTVAEAQDHQQIIVEVELTLEAQLVQDAAIKAKTPKSEMTP